MTVNVIETAGLRRTFGKKGEVEAVAGVDLKVGAGSIFGFLGPNGAGKTTTLRILVDAPAADRAARPGSWATTSRSDARAGPPADRLRRPDAAAPTRA